MLSRNTNLVTSAYDDIHAADLTVRLDGAIVTPDNQVVAALNPISIPGDSPYSFVASIENAPASAAPAPVESAPAPSFAALTPNQLETLVADRQPFTLAPLQMEIGPEAILPVETPGAATIPEQVPSGALTTPQVHAIDTYNATLAAASEPVPVGLSATDAANLIRVNQNYVSGALANLLANGLTFGNNGAIQNAATGDVVAAKGPLNVPGQPPYTIIAPTPSPIAATTPASTPSPSVSSSNQPEPTNSNTPQAQPVSTNPITRVLTPIGIAASLIFGTPVTSGITDALNSINAGLGDSMAGILSPSAQAAPFNPSSGQALADAVNSACKATGCNAPLIQKALSGVCSIESVGCNSQVPHPGYQYQGLFQVGTAETARAIAALRQIAQSPNLSSAEQVQAASAANAAQAQLNAGMNPNTDPVLGAWLGVGYHFSNGTLPKISAVTNDPNLAAAYGMLGQIAPDTFTGNFGPNKPMSIISVLHLQMNSYLVWYGATASQAAQAVLNKFGSNIGRGVVWSAQFTPSASPAPIPAGGTTAPTQLQKSDVTVVGDSIGQGVSSHGFALNSQPVQGVPISNVVNQINALPNGSKVAVIAGTNDFGDTASKIRSDVEAVIAAAKAKNIQIVAWVGASKDPTNATLDAQLAIADSVIKEALPSSIPFVDLRSASLDQYRFSFHYSPLGYTAIGDMIMAAANGNAAAAPTVAVAAPPLGGWRGTPGNPSILPGNPGRIPGIMVINLSQVAGATAPIIPPSVPVADPTIAGKISTLQQSAATLAANNTALSGDFNAANSAYKKSDIGDAIKYANAAIADGQVLIQTLSTIAVQTGSAGVQQHATQLSADIPSNVLSLDKPTVDKILADVNSSVADANVALNSSITALQKQQQAQVAVQQAAQKAAEQAAKTSALPATAVTAVDKQTGMAYLCDTTATADCQTSFRKEILLERLVESGKLSPTEKYTIVPSANPHPAAASAPAVSAKPTAVVQQIAASSVAPGSVLYEIPANFDPTKPATAVYYFHGDGGSITDSINRQQVIAQITASGRNAVLVAPQFASPVADNAGKLATPQGFKDFVAETNQKLATMSGDSSNASRFQAMPITVVGYSGGYVPASAAVQGLGSQISTLEILDGSYSSLLSPITTWLQQNPSATFVSECSVTCGGNATLAGTLHAAGIAMSADPSVFIKGANIISVGKTLGGDCSTDSASGDCSISGSAITACLQYDPRPRTGLTYRAAHLLQHRSRFYAEAGANNRNRRIEWSPSGKYSGIPAYSNATAYRGSLFHRQSGYRHLRTGRFAVFAAGLSSHNHER